MSDAFDLVERPDRAQLEAARAEITAFREDNPTLTRTGLAVAFVAKRGSATSAELATLLELKPDQYPSVELSSAVQNERLVRDGKNWTLGSNRVAYQGKTEPKPDALESGAELGRIEKPASAHFPSDDVKAMVARRSEPRAKAKPDALESGAELGRREPKPLDVPRFTEKEAGKPLQELKQALREPEPAKPSRCRFAVWSDGKVEIEFPSLPSVVLSREEFDDLVRFVAKERA